MDRTRRRVLGGIASGLTAGAAGCLGGTSGGRQTADGTDTATTSTATTTADTSYTASIVPAGEVTFPDVPETWLCYNGGWADMAFALGQRDGFLTAGNMIPGFFFEPFGLDVPRKTTCRRWPTGTRAGGTRRCSTKPTRT
ncbi:hypothetical protein ACFQRB_10085 [Halobaculum litoreum]|uniref:Uncharacterized protein n=1 Tax=Halobaculum litoreum TaxID=3031998 RepID=A0ABD5XNV8_9EURY